MSFFPKGVDPEYDKAITAFYSPYHNMVNVVCRLAVEHDCLAEQAIALSAKLGLEGATLHFAIFPKFWTDLYQSQTQMRDSSVSETIMKNFCIIRSILTGMFFISEY